MYTSGVDISGQQENRKNKENRTITTASATDISSGAAGAAERNNITQQTYSDNKSHNQISGKGNNQNSILATA